MTAAEVLELAARMAALWPSYRPPQTRDDAAVLVAAWLPLLADLPADVVAAALNQAAAEGGEFAPPPGRLRHRVIVAASPPAPDEGQAWGELLTAIGRCGHTGIPAWSHPALDAVVQQLGGWQHICRTFTTASEVADRAHFSRFYRAAVDRHRLDPTPGPDRELLAGMTAGLLRSTDELDDRLALEPGRLPNTRRVA
jgi:hypothetical protein